MSTGTPRRGRPPKTSEPLPDSPGETLGERVTYFRRHSGLSQKALADQAGVSQPYIAQVEAGQKGSDSITTIVALALALGVGPNELDPRLSPHFEAP